MKENNKEFKRRWDDDKLISSIIEKTADKTIKDKNIKNKKVESKKEMQHDDKQKHPKRKPRNKKPQNKIDNKPKNGVKSAIKAVKNKEKQSNKEKQPNKGEIDKIYQQIANYQKEIDELLKESTIDDEMKIYVLSTNLLGLRVEQLSKTLVSILNNSQ